MTEVPTVRVIGGCSSGLPVVWKYETDSDVDVERNRCLPGAIRQVWPACCSAHCRLQSAEKEMECDGPSRSAGTVISAHHNTYEESFCRLPEQDCRTKND